MLRVDVEAEGDFGSTDVTKFIVNATENAIIGKARIYATDTVSAFSTTKLFAEGASTPYEFDGKYTISDRGVYKFWVAYDIVPTATVGQKRNGRTGFCHQYGNADTRNRRYCHNNR